MADICELILEQHHDMRRRFAELDDYRASTPMDEASLTRVWEALHRLLDAHAEAEEMVFYPLLLKAAGGDEKDAVDETRDAIKDHNKIRDAGTDADKHPVGSDEWWSVVMKAREDNSTHMAEEERGALSLTRTAIDPDARLEAGSKWEAFMTGRLRELAEKSHDKDPDTYISERTGSAS